MAQPGWLSRIADAVRLKMPPSPPPPENAVIATESWIVGKPQLPADFSPRTLVDEGYRKNVVVYVCVNEIAQTAPSPPLILRDRKTLEPIKSSPLLDLLARPAPDLSMAEILEICLIHQQTTGVGYIHKGRNSAGQVVQLRPLRPDRMFPIPGPMGDVVKYEYRLASQTKGIMVPASDVIALRLHDPLNDYGGLSPLMVAALWGDIDSEAATYLRDFFANGAVPLGILRAKSPRVNKDDADRLKMEWRNTVGRGDGNKSKWHDIAVMGADVEYQALGAEVGSIKMDPMFGMSETRICAAFGVPVSIVGLRAGMVSGSLSDGSKNREARRTFWTETLVPIDRRLSQALTRGLVVEFDEGQELVFDVDKVPELQEDLNARTDRAAKLFAGGLAWFNEARKMADLEEAPQDYLFVPSGGKFVPKAVVESGALPEPALPAPAPLALLPAGEDQPNEGQGVPWNGREVQGKGKIPADVEALLASEGVKLKSGFEAAVAAGVRASDSAALAAALKAGSKKDAAKAVAVDVFAKRYGEELERHLVRVAQASQKIHERHHLGDARETHALKDLPAKVADRIVSRVKLESARFEKDARNVIQSQILAVINGEQKAITADSIIASIGLSERQHGQLMKQFDKMLRDDVPIARMEKEIDKFRVKLLRERAERIAGYETKLAESYGQRAAWEEMLADGSLKGGRRHWRKMWVVQDDERLCPVCEGLDGEEVPLDGLFDEEFYGPPEPHDHCRCSVVLVEVS